MSSPDEFEQSSPINYTPTPSPYLTMDRYLLPNYCFYFYLLITFPSPIFLNMSCILNKRPPLATNLLRMCAARLIHCSALLPRVKQASDSPSQDITHWVFLARHWLIAYYAIIACVVVLWPAITVRSPVNWRAGKRYRVLIDIRSALSWVTSVRVQTVFMALSVSVQGKE